MALARLVRIAVFAISLPSVFFADVSGQTPPVLPLDVAAGTWSTERNAGISDEMSLQWTDGRPVVRLARYDFGALRETTFSEHQQQASVTWDGARLRGRVIVALDASPALVIWSVQQTVDIDLVFDRPQTRWVGTFTRDSVTSQVVLRRPVVRPAPAEFEQLVGKWCPPSGLFAPDRLTIDRNVDSLLALAYSKEKVLFTRRGDRSVVVTMDVNTGHVAMEEMIGMCCGIRFSGFLSDDGAQIEGRWIGGKGWSTSAPIVYVKMK